MRKSGGDIDVTLVIPAFNEAARLPRSIPALLVAVEQLDARVEIILVDDGSTDTTPAVAARHFGERPDTRILQLPWNCGKGAAVRAGVSAAKGHSIVFLDADLAADIAHLPELLAMLDTVDVALGSRTRTGAEVEGRTAARELGARAYRALVSHVTRASVVDTQCGFKAFRGPAAKLLFSMTSATGFGFDVEILTLAKALDLRISEVPIRWTAIDGGHVSLRQHGLGMLGDLQRARRHQQRALSHNWNWTTPEVIRRHLHVVADLTASQPSPEVIHLDQVPATDAAEAALTALG
jgi:dolichyl-phosphate beta-glucosyltransferase